MFGYEDKFIHKIEVANTNVESKTKRIVSNLNLLPLYRSSPGVHTLILLYVTVAEVPAIFTDADTRIEGVQIGGHKTKQQNLLITPPFFLRGFTCLTRIPVNLKL